jgi:hypothetical protein
MSGSAATARISRAKAASSKNLGKASSRTGRSPISTGTRAGASSHSHSVIRTNRLRSVCNRRRMVAGFKPRAARWILYASTWLRLTSATPATAGSWPVTKVAKPRRSDSHAVAVPGR